MPARFTRQVQVRLTDEQFDAMKAASDAERVPLSTALRLVIGWAIEQEQAAQLSLLTGDEDRVVSLRELLRSLADADRAQEAGDAS